MGRDSSKAACLLTLHVVHHVFLIHHCDFLLLFIIFFFQYHLFFLWHAQRLKCNNNWHNCMLHAYEIDSQYVQLQSASPEKQRNKGIKSCDVDFWSTCSSRKANVAQDCYYYCYLLFIAAVLLLLLLLLFILWFDFRF